MSASSTVKAVHALFSIGAIGAVYADMFAPSQSAGALMATMIFVLCALAVSLVLSRAMKNPEFGDQQVASLWITSFVSALVFGSIAIGGRLLIALVKY